MRWRHDVESVVADTADELLTDNAVLSTINFAAWPEEELAARAARGLPTRCEPDKPRCRLTGRCRLCGFMP